MHDSREATPPRGDSGAATPRLLLPGIIRKYLVTVKGKKILPPGQLIAII